MTTSRPVRVRALVLLSAAVTALVTAAPPALAREAPAPGGADEFRWAVQPSSPTGPTGRNQFVYDLAPGQQIDDHVAVTNLSAKPLTFTVYPTDAFTAVDGAFALLPASQPARDTGNWVGLDRKPLTVRPGQRVVVPFRLTVPKDATPGDHAAGVVASVSEQRVDGEGQRVNVDRRVAARIYLRVAGPLTPSAEIESAQVRYDNPVLPFVRGTMSVTYRVRNSGNVRVGGKVRLRATGLLGVPLSGTQEVDLPEMLPGAQVTLTRRLDGVWPAGLVTGAVAVEPTTSQGALSELVRTDSTLTPPWTLLYLLLVVGILLLVRWWRRRAAAVTDEAPVTAEAPVVDDAPAVDARA
ncbi:WxL protein peptidoglycan domain-containing protein [Micromonospora sp. NPDC050397]|uniref:WxL protein peptidoglycan domain-containing protein n=1 Tax=Micromonospora sp. NPDC050397 TaxID=3364279 RepID=UPI0038511272